MEHYKTMRDRILKEIDTTVRREMNRPSTAGQRDLHYLFSNLKDIEKLMKHHTEEHDMHDEKHDSGMRDSSTAMDYHEDPMHHDNPHEHTEETPMPRPRRSKYNYTEEESPK
jgi:hypothetical protein